MSTARDYLHDILWRGRIPMEPKDFVPDWRDSPRRFKYYPAAQRLPLPDGRAPDGQDGFFTLPLLSDMLRHSYGLLGRRLAPHANSDLPTLPVYRDANWWRGTASGGGLYPVSVYWVAGSRGPVTPGVYHYAPAHHEMRRLLAGDVSGQVRAALAGADIPDTDQFLVLGVKYWQNAFKYNSFCFHAVSMDVGTITHTWQLLAADHGMDLRPVMWFDDAALSELLGVTCAQEGIFAVVPLPWRGATRDSVAGHDAGVPVAAGDGAAGDRMPQPVPAVRLRDRERSHTVLTFEAVTGLQRATSAPGARPSPQALAPARAWPPREGGARVRLPACDASPGPVLTALRARRSSFGRFSAEIPTEPAELAAVLDGAIAAAGYRTDVSGPDASLVKLYVFASHVRGVPPGAYEYDPAGRQLISIDDARPGYFLQSNYFLANYNLEQAGAVIVPVVRAAAVLEAVGDRGYRLVNAVVGAVAQGAYTGAARAGLGCGAALGFDNIAYRERLGITESDEAPLLIVMIGRERAQAGDYDYRIA